MKEVISVYNSDATEWIDLLALSELRINVIYTYYNKLEDPLYVGGSRNFYAAHFFNAQRLPFFHEIEYVGFIFLYSEENMKESKEYYVRARSPKYNHGKYQELPYIKGCNAYTDDLVVHVREMEQRWREELYSDDGEGERYLAELDAEVLAEMQEESKAGRKYLEVDVEGEF